MAPVEFIRLSSRSALNVFSTPCDSAEVRGAVEAPPAPSSSCTLPLPLVNPLPQIRRGFCRGVSAWQRLRAGCGGADVGGAVARRGDGRRGTVFRGGSRRV